MSRLWPESLSVGLFESHGWLARGKQVIALPNPSSPATPATTSQSTAPDLTALASVLDEQVANGGLRKGRVSVLVSDATARIITLPWQPDLTKPAEWQTYAQARFEAAGIALDGYLMHAEFAAPERLGLAYALPATWLAQLNELITAKGLKLSEVLPVSAAAYYRHRTVRQSKQTVVLLEQADRLCALVVDRRGLIKREAEPVTGNAEQALRRLLTRLAATSSEITHVQYWSTKPAEQLKLPEAIKVTLGEVTASVLTQTVWS
ncbi:hypothetical protein [Chitinimonas sp. BJYL2]|uniref:hypothetical protein n=1 Tax=Chitinimonas sp. BJYL2 TaxID=2976696 RepID=UPI0022B4AFF5|nr:hypothetical protein [Chitinimonas sp. BJYL2]